MKYLIPLLFIVPHIAIGQNLLEWKALVTEVSFWQYNNAPSVQMNVGVLGKIPYSYFTLGTYFSYEQHNESLPDGRKLAMKQYYGMVEGGLQLPFFLGITLHIGVGLLFGADVVMVGNNQRGGNNYGFRNSLRVGKQWQKSGLYLNFNRNWLIHNYLLSESAMVYPSMGISYFLFFGKGAFQSLQKSQLCPTYW